jgi:hypothetical protein
MSGTPMRRSDGHDAEPRHSALHHFAIEISLDYYDDVLAHLIRRGLRPNTRVHPRMG